MYSVRVRDHVFIAHSLSGETFGPAQNLHGATYVVDAEFRRLELDPEGVVVDIGAARRQLRRVLDGFDYRNLDDDPDFAGVNTTTEVLARAVFDRLAECLRRGAMGAAGCGVTGLRVRLAESPVAGAAFEGDPRMHA